ncbi:MAG: DNA recombination protein RmuC [Cytophagales bacterium]|nr:DNA recombination protein RmuC [Cytophagales bacterium]
MIVALIVFLTSTYIWEYFKRKKVEQIKFDLQKVNIILQQREEDLKNKNQELKNWEEKIEILNTANQNLEIEIVKLKTEKDHLENEIKKGHEDKDSMVMQFQNIAMTLMEEKTKKFTEQNQINMNNILKPLADNIHMFEQQIKDSNKQANDQTVALRLELAKLYTLNTKITQEAENLANAIKGDTKIQGNWGEMILEKILETSGLERDREYTIQTSLLMETGKRYQPDVVVHLPMERHIIIDSKVSLNNYEQYFNSEDKIVKTDQLKKHFTSIKKHILELAEKNYQTLYSVGSLDFVLMFIPIEQAYTLIVQNEKNIFTEAYERNVILVSPSTLIATLRTISNIWKSEYQNKNALDIAQQSGALYDKFVGFIEDIKLIGKNLDSTKNAYADAVKKLYEGQGNLINRAEKIKSLGVKTTKSLDQKLISLASDNDH